MKSFEKSFFWTTLFISDSGLSVKVHVTNQRTNRRPTLLVETGKRMVSILIDDQPRVLSGHLEIILKKEILEWVKYNKKPMLEYWSEETSTAELIRDLINMKQVIKREPTKQDLRLLEAVTYEELLTVEDEVKLVNQIQRGEGDVEAAKEKLMRGNQRFVRTVAQRYVGSMFSLEELVAEGNIGLEHAIYKFDETRGFKFISYAVWWIRQSIQQAIVLKARAESELKGLSARELDIIRMYFGFGCEKASLEEIQEKYDLTPQRAIAIKDKALRKHFNSKEKLNTVRVALMGDPEVDNNED